MVPEDSVLVKVPASLYCPTKRKRVELGTELKRARTEPYLSQDTGDGWWNKHPKCMERFLPHLERITGASRTQMSLAPNRTSANVQYWLQVNDKIFGISSA